MSVNELFFQSAVINAIIFLWLASAVSTVRVLLRCDKKVTSSLVLATLFGPFALMGAWILEGAYLRKKNLKQKIFLSFSSVAAIAVVSALSIGAFHRSFVYGFSNTDVVNDSLLFKIALCLVGLGALGGIILAMLTRRVAFFEASWCTFFFTAYLTFIKEWAASVFSYGTSAAYFIVIISCTTTLFLIFLTLGGSLGYLLFGEGRFNHRFSYESFIGTRFLMTKRGSQVISLITFISIFAVMIACSGMIVVMSVMNGFSSDLRSKILGANAHLMVLKYGNDFSEYSDVIKKTKDLPGVKGASPFVLNEGMISSKRNLSGSIITGIDVAAELMDESGRLLKYVSRKSMDHLLNPQLIDVALEGSGGGPLTDDPLKEPVRPLNELPGVIIGKVMASDLQVFVGDVVNIISPVGEMGPTGPIPKAKPFRVAGLFNSGMYEYDAKFAYIRLNDAQSFFNLKDSVSGVEYRVQDIEQTRKIAHEIDKAIGGYPFYSRDWMQMNRNMFSALQLEKIAMLIILGTLIFMASLLILVTLVMVVMEKGKDIAILKSMGATDASIMKIFVTYGLFVGGIGAILGGAVGLALCLVIEKIGIRLDPDVYYFSNLPVRIVLSEVFLVVSSAILISFLATIPPALFAARLRPVDGLRYE